MAGYIGICKCFIRKWRMGASTLPLTQPVVPGKSMHDVGLP